MSGASKSTTTATPWKIQEKYLKGGFEKAAHLLDKGPADYYGGKTLAGFTGEERNAQAGIMNVAKSQMMKNMLRDQRQQLGASYRRAAGMDQLAKQAQKTGLRSAAGIRQMGNQATAAAIRDANKVGAYGQGAMNYGQGAMKRGLSQGQYSNITPFQSSQLKEMLAGKVNVDALNPVLAARKRDIMGQLEGPGGMLAQIRQKTLGYQPGGGSRGDIVTGMAAKEATQRLMDESKGMYADAFSQAQQRRLPAGQMALDAQLAAQQLGMQGAQQRLGAGQLRQQGYGQGIGARTGAGQLQQQAFGTGLSARQAAGGLQQQAFGTGLSARQAAGQQGLSALDRAQGVMDSQYDRFGRMQGVGAQKRAMKQEEYNQKMAKYNYNANKHQQALQNYMSMISGQYGGSTTSNPSALSSMGQLAALFQGFQSDIRVKENIVPEATHWKGFNVYTFNYIGDDTPRRGVMAQEVERTRPDAVYEIGGVKHVAYGIL